MAGLNCQNYQTGEHVNYNGRDAVVISNNYSSRSITIEVDGKRITVDRNDLFGMNKDISSSYYDSQIANLDKSIEKKQAQIEENKTLWSIATKKIHDCRLLMRSILNEFGVSSFKQLTDENAKKQYSLAMTDKTSARSVQIGASSDIISDAHSAGSDILYRGTLLNEQSIYNSQMG